VPTLLIVHHTPSPAMQEMFEAAVSGARTDQVDGVDVVIRPALTAAAADVLRADGYLLGTPANIGYMSGALKHFFDGIYYPCLEATRRRPFGLYVHGASDTGGAVRAVETITTGLRWRMARPPVTVTGPPGKPDLEACWELGAVLAAELAVLFITSFSDTLEPCFTPVTGRGRVLRHEAELEASLAAAVGLRLDRYLTDDHAWLRAVPAWA